MLIIPAINAETFEEVQKKIKLIEPFFLGFIWISPTELLLKTLFGTIWWNSL